MKHLKSNFILIALALVFFNSCTTTKMSSSWREPDKSIVVENLRKVLVVALLKDETSRRKAEDQMAGFLKGRGVVSYNYLNERFNENNEGVLRKKIKDDGFDGAVTMRLVDIDKDEVYRPGYGMPYRNIYSNFSGYMYRNWSFYSTPGYYTTTKTYLIETNVYSIKEDRIIWIGLTETTNPEGLEKLTAEVTKTVFKQMIKEGFITNQ